MLHPMMFALIGMLLAGSNLSQVAKVDAAESDTARTIVQFKDDFARFQPGALTAPLGKNGGAIQEYHYLPNRGVDLGPWANAICHIDAWVAGEQDGHTYLEQNLASDDKDMVPRLFSPLFITGEPEWARLHSRGLYPPAVEQRIRWRRVPLPHESPPHLVQPAGRQDGQARESACRSRKSIVFVLGRSSAQLTSTMRLISTIGCASKTTGRKSRVH